MNPISKAARSLGVYVKALGCFAAMSAMAGLSAIFLGLVVGIPIILIRSAVLDFEKVAGYSVLFGVGVIGLIAVVNRVRRKQR